MRELRGVLDAVHSQGAHILETDTGRRSDKPVDAAAMVLDAAIELRKGPPASVSRANGALSKGRPLKKDRMAKLAANKIWKSEDYASDTAALKHMPGWTRGTAWHHFGRSGRAKPGRPRKAK